MLIGIRFPDNDFHNTIQPFLKLLLETDDRMKKDALTKARIHKLWNMLAPGLYLTCQNSFRYRCDDEDIAHTSKYLIDNMAEKQVYFDQEVWDHIIACEYWDNGEFHYIDTDAKQIYCV